MNKESGFPVGDLGRPLSLFIYIRKIICTHTLQLSCAIIESIEKRDMK